MTLSIAFSRRIAHGRALPFFGCLALAMSLALAPLDRAWAEMTARPVSLVELFTSQGCSSCPPADELIGEMADDPGLLVLSLHVDYWDYLGWRDTFGSAAFTKRQRGYAADRKDGKVYTPQAVINGTTHVVGSDEAGIVDALETTSSPSNIAIDVDKVGDQVIVTIDNPALFRGPRRGTLWLASYTPQEQVEIERGENKGLLATYTHVVHKLVPVADWNGGDMTVTLPLDMFTAKGQRCALILQEGDPDRPGRLVTAVAIDGTY